MNDLTLEKLHTALLASRSEDTCYEPDQHLWCRDNPAFGQCYITSLIVQDYFGGDIVKTKLSNGIGHYRNWIDGHDVDLTRSQFIDGEIILAPVITTRNAMEENERYITLKNRVEKLL